MQLLYVGHTNAALSVCLIRQNLPHTHISGCCCQCSSISHRSHGRIEGGVYSQASWSVSSNSQSRAGCLSILITPETLSIKKITSRQERWRGGGRGCRNKCACTSVCMHPQEDVGVLCHRWAYPEDLFYFKRRETSDRNRVCPTLAKRHTHNPGLCQPYLPLSVWAPPGPKSELQ